MRFLKSFGVAALAALALTAIAGASMASASEPKAEGTIPNGFTGAGGTGTLSITPSPSLTVHCTTSKSTGTVNTSTSINATVVTFHGCTQSLTGTECHTAGQPAGTIVTNTLHGTLVYLETGKNTVGVLLTPTAGGTFATFDCPSFLGNEHITVTGQVLGHLSPVNTSTTKYTLTFSQASAGHPIPASYLTNSGCVHTSTTEALLSHGTGPVPFFNKPSSLVGTHTITLNNGPLKINSTSCV